MKKYPKWLRSMVRGMLLFLLALGALVVTLKLCSYVADMAF